jgi:hypothetical protein
MLDMEVTKMFDYDRFAIGASAVTTTGVALGQNNSGTLVVGTNYRMRVSRLSMTNTGSAADIMTIQKVNSSGLATVLLKQGIPSSATVTLTEDQNIIVDSAEYLKASMAVGTGAVFGIGEFILE